MSEPVAPPASRTAARSPQRRARGPIWALAVALAVAAAAVYALALDGGAEPAGSWSHAVVLALAFLAAQARAVRVHFNREAHNVSLVELPLTLGLLTTAPGPLLAALVAGSAAALALARRRPPVRAALALAQLALAGTVALAVFGALAPAAGPGTWAAAIAAACSYTLAAAVLVWTSSAIVERAPVRSEHVRVALLAVLAAAGTATLTVVGHRLVAADPLAALLLVIPAALWVAAVSGYARTRSRHRQLEFLYESMRDVQSAEGFRGAADRLLRQLSELLRADFVELLFLGTRGQTGTVQVFTHRGSEVLGDARAIRGEERLVLIHAALSEGSVLLARGHRAHPLDGYLRSRDLRDAVVVPLRGEERELGAIVVGDRASDVSTFAPEDCRLLETFAAHAAVLLENDRLERSLEQLTELEGRLRHQAYHDSLTGLANRVSFLDATSEALRSDAEPPAILFVDLDDFKITNDSLGHAAGDELLRVAAQRVSGSLRAGDLAARLGGDEFAVLLHGAELEDAEEVAARITARLDEPALLDGHECSLRGSIGIARAGRRSTAETLLRDADLAMYAAKGRGTGTHVVFHPEMQHRVRARHSVAAALSRSLDRGEIAVVYQPVVSLASGAVSGFEALVRWRRGGGGLLLPADFLEVAQRTGMIAPIGRFVLGEACRRAADWLEVDPALRVSVNLSAAELGDPAFSHELATLLGAIGLAPSRLTVEITESAAMTDPAESCRVLRRLRDVGVGVALDDFGTGYSSLSHLETMPVDTLKVPKELVDGLRGDRPRTVVLAGIQALAQSLGLGLVAEGVEEREQLTILRELGYPEAQGFLLSAPLSAEGADRLIREQALLERPAAAA